MAPPRFFIPNLDASQAIAALPDEEAGHLARVLRLRPGAEVHVFDGIGHEWRAEVAEVQGRRAAVRLIHPVAAAPERRVPITLVLSVLKGDKMDDVVRDAVMLGVSAIRPVVSTRTEVSPSVLARSGRAERWRRVAVSSSKQCGRACVPPVHDVVRLDAWLRAEAPEPARLMLVEPGAPVAAVPLREIHPPAAAALIVGPEGGWTREELEAAVAAGVRLVSLGPRTLRADAVPLVALAMCEAIWEA